jgi:hypothetical protein
VGSAGLAVGCVTFWGAQLGEESGSRHRPRSSLVAVAWAMSDVEGAGPRGGGTSPYQRGGGAHPSLHVCLGQDVFQHLGVSSGISCEL